jgi:hypothetical protein
MQRLAIMLSLATGACMSAPDRPRSDALVDSPVADAPADMAMGSAARAALDKIEASPKDYQLQVGVLVMSLVVVIAPLGKRRRRA